MAVKGRVEVVSRAIAVITAHHEVEQTMAFDARNEHLLKVSGVGNAFHARHQTERKLVFLRERYALGQHVFQGLSVKLGVGLGFGLTVVELQTTDRKSTRPELQSRQYLVCRLLLEKKKKFKI